MWCRVATLTSELTFVEKVQSRIGQNDCYTSEDRWKNDSEYGFLSYGIHESKLESSVNIENTIEQDIRRRM